MSKCQIKQVWAGEKAVNGPEAIVKRILQVASRRNLHIASVWPRSSDVRRSFPPRKHLLGRRDDEVVGSEFGWTHQYLTEISEHAHMKVETYSILILKFTKSTSQATS